MLKDVASHAGLTVSIGQYSDAGRKPSNQDFHGATVPSGAALQLKGIALAVADGISSSPVSAEAAETAVKCLMTDYYCTPDTWTVRTSASRVMSATNSWLHAQSRRARIGDMNHGLVCTLSALILKGREAHLFHVGDSRIWRLSGDSLEPLTTDHRVILSASESYLGRAIGAEPRVDIDHRRLGLARGDVFVLTTDGVHEHLQPGFIARTIRSSTDLDAAARAIAAVALDNGSADNLTVQIVRVEALPTDDRADIGQDVATLPVPPLPRPGTVLDGYSVLRELTATARSHVYLAAAPDGTRVALKIPSSELRESPAHMSRFMLEEWIARRVDSAHVLKADIPRGGRSALYVVTEFVEGQTLRQWMTDRAQPDLDTVRDILEQIARGLRALHRREMLHQDLRPENVMIDRDGTVKIIDLGSVSVAGVEEAAPGLLGEMPGTFQYTAPEYLSGDGASARSDQYALGVIAYEMLTGRLPYGTQAARVRSRTDQRRLRYDHACGDVSAVPEWVDAALRRAVHPDPLRRYDALSEFNADLRAPAPGWRARRHRPLVERDPVRFWQGVAAALALLVVLLLIQLGSEPALIQ